MNEVVMHQTPSKLAPQARFTDAALLEPRPGPYGVATTFIVESAIMDDERIWSFEESLWLGDAEHYRASIDDECLMVLPTSPFVMSGRQAAEAVANTPRWSRVELSERQVARPQEGLIVIAYKAHAERTGTKLYEAHCTSTYRRLAHEEWRVIQHQQTPPLVSNS